MSLSVSRDALDASFSATVLKAVEVEAELILDFNALGDLVGVEIVDFSEQTNAAIFPGSIAFSLEIEYGSYDADVDSIYIRLHNNPMANFINVHNAVESKPVVGKILASLETQVLSLQIRW